MGRRAQSPCESGQSLFDSSGSKGTSAGCDSAACSEEGVDTAELQRALRKTLCPVNPAAGSGLQPCDA